MANRKLKEHRINREWCKGCGMCIEFFAKKVLEMDQQDKAQAVRPEDCVPPPMPPPVVWPSSLASAN